MRSALHHFLNPKSIAIVGASSSPGSTGFLLVHNLVKYGFNGKIYPVNPRLGEILGMRVYHNIKDIPDIPDLAVIAIRAPLVWQALKECGEKGVKGSIVVSDGFADDGDEGKRMQKELVEISRSYGVRIIGPNTQGLINLHARLVIASVPTPPVWRKMEEGRLSILAQTALFYWDWLLKYSGQKGHGISKGIDLGNMCDIDHGEVLEYLLADSNTDVIGIHIETIRDPDKFVFAMEKMSLRKPVVILKAGKTIESKEAILTHTGSIAGDDRIFDALFRQKGVIRAEDPEEFQDLLRAFLFIKSLPCERVAILTFSGAAGSLATDILNKAGMKLAEFSHITIERVRETLPSWASVKNPLDFMQAFEVRDFNRVLTTAIDALLADINVDSIFLITIVSKDEGIVDVLEILRRKIINGISKPIVLWPLVTDEEVMRELSTLEGDGFAIYPSMKRAITALSACNQRYRFLKDKSRI
jgi:acyl-CoA synthetase (NDP forming)